MRLKVKDIKLALENLPVGLETIDLYTHSEEQSLEIVFTDANRKLVNLIVYEARMGITPEIRHVAKLYKKD